MEAAGGGAGVDSAGEALACQVDKILDETAPPAGLPDNEGIAFAQHGRRRGQSRPFGASTADLVVDDLLAPSLGQSLDL